MFRSKPINPKKPNGTKALPFRPYGLYILVETSAPTEPDFSLAEIKNATPAEPDTFFYQGKVKGVCADGEVHQSELEFSLPKCDKDGFFKVGETLYVFPVVGLPDPWKPMILGEYYFLSKAEVAKRVLEDAFAKALAGFFFNSKPGATAEINQVAFQTSLQSGLTQGERGWVRHVRDSEFYRGAFKSSLILLPRQDRRRTTSLRFPESLIGKADPASTSASEMINMIYQMAEGAKVEKQEIVPGTSESCEFNNQNGIALALTPKRSCLLRAAVMNSLELMRPEPRVAGAGGVLQTANFLTALMDLGPATFEDQIAVSESAALRMEGCTKQRIVVWTDAKPDILLGKGEILSTLQPLAEMPVSAIVSGNAPTEEEEGDEEKEGKFRVLAPTLLYTTVIEEITVIRHFHMGKPGVRIVWDLKSFLPLSNGDKITTLSGGKGVARIIPDDQMPKTPDGRIVEICISPSSVGRRHMDSLPYEMMLNEWSVKENEGKSLDVSGDQIPIPFTSLVASGYRHKTALTLAGEALAHKTWVGQLAWMRHNKIALKLASSVGETRPLTIEGLPVDNASQAGQKCEASKGLALINSGMPATLREILGEGTGIGVMEDMVEALERPAREFRKLVAQ